MDEQINTSTQLQELEEVANALTHGIGFFLSVIGLGVLWFFAIQSGDPWKLISASIFGFSMVLLYASSTLYHSTRDPQLKYTFRILDHCAIYVMIAGSYTPFTLLTLRDTFGWILFAIVWAIAICGIIFKIFFVGRFKILSLMSYLGMGWLIVFAGEQLVAQLPENALYLLIAGGLSYTVGTVAFILERLAFSHAVWHLFVLSGTCCHYFAVLLGAF